MSADNTPPPAAFNTADATPQAPGESIKKDEAITDSPTASRGAGGMKSRRSSSMGSMLQASRRRSSGLFAAARASFVRNRGQSGASVETLRGNTGADFEGYATVQRGEGEGLLDWLDITNLLCRCCKKKEGLQFLLIKGYHCFVFKDDEGKAPKYAIELMNRRAVIQPDHSIHIPSVPHPGASHDTTYTTINLETSLGDVEYQFTFANMDDNLATKFCNAVSVASNEATTEQVRKRLGHENLLDKRTSVRFANNIGAAKAKDQPEVPVGAKEVLAEMPTPGMGVYY